MKIHPALNKLRLEMDNLVKKAWSTGYNAGYTAARRKAQETPTTQGELPIHADDDLNARTGF